MRRAFAVGILVALGLLTSNQGSITSHDDGGDTWAILVDTSRYFVNYRHATNALLFYELVRGLGLTDDRILLLLADHPSADPRNPFPARMFFREDRGQSVSGPDVEVDLKGHDVSVQAFLDILTGEGKSPPLLRSSRKSRVLIYLTGHGGEGFIKFHDIDELASSDFGDAIQTMHTKGRYHEMLVLADTCQAATLLKPMAAPNVFFLSSSRLNENSYALHGDPTIGISTVDRFTAATIHFFARSSELATAPSLADLVDSYEPSLVYSQPSLVSSSARRPEKVSIDDFFSMRPPVVHFAALVNGTRNNAEALWPNLDHGVDVLKRTSSNLRVTSPGPSTAEYVWQSTTVLILGASLLGFILIVN